MAVGAVFGTDAQPDKAVPKQEESTPMPSDLIAAWTQAGTKIGWQTLPLLCG
jgi:hypothetical protein